MLVKLPYRLTSPNANQFAFVNDPILVTRHDNISPYAFIVNEENAKFPGGVGEMQGLRVADISEADYLFQYTPELPYLDNTIRVDIHFNLCLTQLSDSDNMLTNGFSACTVSCRIFKGIDYHSAYSPIHPVDSRIIFNNVGGSRQHSYDPYVHYTASYDFHQDLHFAPGERLYLLFEVATSSPSYWGLNIYSGEYTSHIDPFVQDPMLELYNSSDPFGPIPNLPKNTNAFCVKLDSSGGNGPIAHYDARVRYIVRETVDIFFYFNTSASAWPGVNTYFKHEGTGALQIIPGSGVTFSSGGTITSPGQGALIKLASDGSQWVITVFPTGVDPNLQFTITGDESYVRMTLMSKVALTPPSNVYMVNESLSRACEIITNDQMRVYSEYYGRTDSRPYPAVADGPGSLRCLTNGLLIRNYSPITALQWGSYTAHNVIETGTSVTLPLAYFTGTPPRAYAQFTAASPITLTIPTHTNISHPAGTQLLIQQSGDGQITLVPESAGGQTVVIDAPDHNLKSSGQGSFMLLTKVEDNLWLISSHAPMFVSLKNLISDLNAIDAIGWAVEPDPVRTGYDCLRIEPIRHFYEDAIIMTCDNVDIIEKELDNGSLISTLNIGYNKWEAEGSNGLDEFATKRQFRTALKSMQTSVDKLSKLVASGYAIEITRRKNLQGNTTDWRYDNDNFVICLKRGLLPDISAIGMTADNGINEITLIYGGTGYVDPPLITIEGGGQGSGATAHAVMNGDRIDHIVVDTPGSGYGTAMRITIAPPPLGVEQGGIGTPYNIIDPATAYNFRISPIRNALRWLWYVLQTMHDPATAKLIFNSGDGNYYARGLKYFNTVESRPLSESDTLMLSDYAAPTPPLFRPETVKFKYPLSYSQWKTIFDNRKGLIGYSTTEGPTQYGWIQDLKYDLYQGIAEFTLKPKINL